MNPKVSSLVMIIVGIGLCGFFGAQLPSPTFKQTTHQMAQDWTAKKVQDLEKNATAAHQKASLNLSSIHEFQNQQHLQSKALQQTPFERLQVWFTERGLWFAIGLFLILGGSLWSRKIAKDHLMAQMDSADSESGDPHLGAVDFGALLIETHQKLNQIKDELTAMTEYDADSCQNHLKTIESLQKDQITRLISAKDQVLLRLGINTFTDIFGSFSQGERRLNRCWSALVDCHLEEAQKSISGASDSFSQALDALDDSSQA